MGEHTRNNCTSTQDMTLECVLRYSRSAALPSCSQLAAALQEARERCASAGLRVEGRLDASRRRVVVRVASSAPEDGIAHRMQALVFALSPDEVALRWIHA